MTRILLDYRSEKTSASSFIVSVEIARVSLKKKQFHPELGIKIKAKFRKFGK